MLEALLAIVLLFGGLWLLLLTVAFGGLAKKNDENRAVFLVHMGQMDLQKKDTAIEIVVIRGELTDLRGRVESLGERVSRKADLN